VVAALEVAKEIITLDASLASQIKETWLSSTCGFDFVPSVV
jgi:hypothetical protein